MLRGIVKFVGQTQFAAYVMPGRGIELKLCVVTNPARSLPICGALHKCVASTSQDAADVREIISYVPTMVLFQRQDSVNL